MHNLCVQSQVQAYLGRYLQPFVRNALAAGETNFAEMRCPLFADNAQGVMLFAHEYTRWIAWYIEISLL